MNQLVPTRDALPALVAGGDERARTRFVEFFASNIRNPHTRRAYVRTIGEFLEWCRRRGVKALDEVRPLHVAAWIERQTRRYSAPTVKQQLAAIRDLFDWLVTGQIVPVNPASSVRGPKHSVKKGKTPVLEPAEARTLLDSNRDRHPCGAPRPGADRAYGLHFRPDRFGVTIRTRDSRDKAP